MKPLTTIKEFNFVSRVVHHVSALFFIAALLLMFYFNQQETGAFFARSWHESLGILVLALYFFRVIWLAWFGKPVDIGSKIDIFIANMAHMLLYGIIIIMPVSGLLVNMAKAKDTSVFGLFTIPGFTERNSGLIEFASSAHSWLVTLAYVLVSLHIFAMLFHHFILKDDLLRRMVGGLKK